MTQKKSFFVLQDRKLYAIHETHAKNILKRYPDKYIDVFGDIEEA